MKKIKRKTKLFYDTVVIPLGKGLQEGFQLKFTESLIEVIKCLLLDKKTEQQFLSCVHGQNIFSCCYQFYHFCCHPPQERVQGCCFDNEVRFLFVLIICFDETYREKSNWPNFIKIHENIYIHVYMYVGVCVCVCVCVFVCICI